MFSPVYIIIIQFSIALRKFVYLLCGYVASRTKEHALKRCNVAITRTPEFATNKINLFPNFMYFSYMYNLYLIYTLELSRLASGENLGI